MGAAAGSSVAGLYVNWRRDEPAASGCAQMRTSNSGNWQANACSDVADYVCETSALP